MENLIDIVKNNKLKNLNPIFENTKNEMIDIIINRYNYDFNMKKLEWNFKDRFSDSIREKLIDHLKKYLIENNCKVKIKKSKLIIYFNFEKDSDLNRKIKEKKI